MHDCNSIFGSKVQLMRAETLGAGKAKLSEEMHSSSHKKEEE